MENSIVFMQLSEVADIVDSLHKTPTYVEEGIPMVRGTDIKTGYLQLDKCLGVNEETYEVFIQKYAPQKGDILITRVGSYGNFSFVNSSKRFCLGQNTTLISPKINPKYLYYCLLSDEVKNQIEHKVVGSSQKTLSLKCINEIKVPILPRNMQDKIAFFLGAIDDKIDNGLEILKNLTQQSRIAFDAWFLKFAPFSDSLVECREELIPKDWAFVQLADVTENIKDRVGQQELKVLSAVNTGNLILSEEYFTKRVFSKDISKYIIVDKGDFAYNPARVNIGSIGINDLGFKGCVSPVYVVFRVAELYRYYFELFTKSERFIAEVKLRASGSVRQSLNYSDFGKIQIAYPPTSVVEKFNNWYQPISEQIKKINEELVVLARIRDTFIPHLLQGDIDLSKINL